MHPFSVLVDPLYFKLQSDGRAEKDPYPVKDRFGDKLPIWDTFFEARVRIAYACTGLCGCLIASARGSMLCAQPHVVEATVSLERFSRPDTSFASLHYLSLAIEVSCSINRTLLRRRVPRHYC